ncbi:triose-phosphate isomerase [bacterium]|nr:triose-phosphate isomerase [bacterium]MCI0606611.1 triose-phosphate isomerase [bacterium]
MRNKFIAGNWKMNTTRAETTALLQALLQGTSAIEKTTIMVAPPFANLQIASELLQNSKIKLGAQNMYWEDKGAFTGEISPLMLKDFNCSYVIIGHSERRQYFRESNQEINRKIQAAFRHRIYPILCVGESLENRERGQTLGVVEYQIRNGLAGFTSEHMNDFTIAYEPVWAIGTGRAATPADAVEVHSYIRSLFAEMFDSTIAESTRIQYGGSVTADNIDSFICEEHIDGALVGGASLKADSFLKIIQAAEQS